MLKEKSKILVVDDEISNVKLLQAILEPQGYAVTTASDGKTNETKGKTNETKGKTNGDTLHILFYRN